MTTERTPSTEAGRRLWDALPKPATPYNTDHRADILAIEAEARAPLVAALEPIATLNESDIRDYEQGLCFFCGSAQEIVPGPRGGVTGERARRPRHEPSCSWVAARAALAPERQETP